MLVLVTARPLELCEESAAADAVLVAWQPGTMAGEALADVLSGDVNPSGKLTMTFPRDVGQIPIFYNPKNTGRPVGALTSQSSEKYTSRYLFTPNEPLYPFGYGLSYTTFEYSGLKVENPRAKIGENVTVSVTLRNSGDRDGSEVAQLYIRDLAGSVTRPVRELKGFEKVFLKAGESRPAHLRPHPAGTLLLARRHDLRAGSGRLPRMGGRRLGRRTVRNIHRYEIA